LTTKAKWHPAGHGRGKTRYFEFLRKTRIKDKTVSRYFFMGSPYQRLHITTEEGKRYIMKQGPYFENIFRYNYTPFIGILAIAVLAWKICMWGGWTSHRLSDVNAWYAIAGVVCVLFGYRPGIEGRQKPLQMRIIAVVMWILVAGAFHSVHYDFARKFFSGQSFRVWSTYHYYLGAKYFNELGYHGLYEQTLVADREGLNRLKNVKIIRNLRTLENEPVDNFLLKRSERFSDERWKAFKKDVEFFTGLRNIQFFQQLLRDHGYNPSPLWTFVGGSLARIFDIKIGWQRTILLYLDLIIGAVALISCIWAFGAAPSAIVFLIFVLLPFNTQRLFGGFLTYDWFYTLLLGLAFFHRGKGRLSAIFWSYSVMTRVFPVIFVLGLLAPIIRDYWKTGAIFQLYRRFIINVAIFCGLCLILGCFNAYGPKSWEMFGENIRDHAEHQVSGNRRVGMKHLFNQKLFSAESSTGIYERRHNFKDQKSIYILLELAMLSGVALIVFRKSGTDAMLWVMPAFFALAASSRYYWSVLACLALLNFSDEKRRPAGAGSLFALGGIACWYFFSQEISTPFLRYVFINRILTLGFFLMILWEIGKGIVYSDADRAKQPSGTSQAHKSIMIRDIKHLTATLCGVFFILVLSFFFVFGISRQNNVGFDKKVESEKRQNKSFNHNVTLEEFPLWIKDFRNSLEWKNHTGGRRLTREILQQSFRKGRQFLINNQKPAGNFNYQYDFVKKEMAKDDHQVRQAGALWGLALMYRYEQTPENKAALDKGLEFFFDHSREGQAGGTLLIAYPGEYLCHTGTVALVALSIIEYLRMEKAGMITIEDEFRKELLNKLDGYLAYLKFVRLKNRHFSSFCFLPIKVKYWNSSPYYDGEALFCLVNAAKYLGHTDLVPVIEESAMAMARDYTIDQWRKDPYSDETKGIFQWACMAFWEYQDAGWKNADAFGDCVLSLSWWIIHTHRILQRTRNTAYAYEGIIPAYRLAKAYKDQDALNDLAYTIDRGLYELTTWQVGGPLLVRNRFLFDHQTNDPLANGGVMNHKNKPPLRIDITQHQMHSIIQAIEYVYTEGSSPADQISNIQETGHPRQR
jgi:hypothetical protein